MRLDQLITDLLSIPENIHSLFEATIEDFTLNSNWLLPQDLVCKYPHFCSNIQQIVICTTSDLDQLI